MARGLFTAFSLTADGRSMVIDQGAYDHGVWAVPFDSARAGVFPESHRLARASSQTTGVISPDGARVLVRRTVPMLGMFDISPIIAFFIVWLLQHAVAGTLLRGFPIMFF